MFDLYSFLTFKNVVCVLVVFVTMVMVLIPHRILDTSTHKRTIYAVLVLLSALFFLIDKTLFGCLLSFILLTTWLSNIALKKLQNFRMENPHEQQHKKH
ncbi:hypothetical protein DJ533_00325 (plasmid) [Acinetobacter defluvii]|uniref:Uncharacterized protein n=1 Tax=Acinetobacter defluvii TaxID=1871111 RepID=A0A2S2F866_9GAMM|nr:hypothetical protein [Acinetobacter defluvii]AWL27164.1 hypothetical protein DJ533_00325 [Acinetobacter defluvii]